MGIFLSSTILVHLTFLDFWKVQGAIRRVTPRGSQPCIRSIQDWIETMMQSYASRGWLQSGGPILPTGIWAMVCYRVATIPDLQSFASCVGFFLAVHYMKTHCLPIVFACRRLIVNHKFTDFLFHSPMDEVHSQNTLRVSAQVLVCFDNKNVRRRRSKLCNAKPFALLLGGVGGAWPPYWGSKGLAP